MLTAFGKFLRKLRIDALCTMKEMSDGLEISVSYLSAVETGKRDIPKNWIEKIIKFFNLNEQQQIELTNSVNDSLTEINFNLSGFSQDKRIAALIFARKLEELDDDEINKLMLTLNKKGEN